MGSPPVFWKYPPLPVFWADFPEIPRVFATLCPRVVNMILLDDIETFIYYVLHIQLMNTKIWKT